MAATTLLRGKVALITGSSTGIGMGILKALSGAGATTVMHGLIPVEELRAKAEAVHRLHGNQVDVSTADLRDPAAIREMIKAVAAAHGSIDILVNNAGIQHVAPVQEFPEDKWNAVMDVILNATFHASKAALPHMLAAGWGRIVNTGSMHALVASPYKSGASRAVPQAPDAPCFYRLNLSIPLLLYLPPTPCSLQRGQARCGGLHQDAGS